VKTLILLVALTFSGCNFLEVKVDVTQRAILDKGDNTDDDYTGEGDTSNEVDKTSTIIKTIP